MRNRRNTIEQGERGCTPYTDSNLYNDIVI